MKKSKLLSVLTAGAVIATTVGTYAAWDKLSVDTTAKAIEFSKPVTVGLDSDLLLKKGNSNLDVKETAPTATGTVSFTVRNEDNLPAKLTITPTITSDSDSISASDLDIVIKEKGGSALKKEGTGFVDSTVTATESYDVEITPANGSETKVQNATNIQLKLTATLSKKESEQD